jgi:hypothetical protein
VRRPWVATLLGLLAGPVFLAVVGETLDNIGAGYAVIAAACLTAAAAAGRLLRSWPFAVAFAASALGYLAFFVWASVGR